MNKIGALGCWFVEIHPRWRASQWLCALHGCCGVAGWIPSRCGRYEHGWTAHSLGQGHHHPKTEEVFFFLQFLNFSILCIYIFAPYALNFHVLQLAWSFPGEGFAASWTSHLQVLEVQVGLVLVGGLVPAVAVRDDGIQQFLESLVWLLVSSDTAHGHNEGVTLKGGRGWEFWTALCMCGIADGVFTSDTFRL